MGKVTYSDFGIGEFPYMSYSGADIKAVVTYRPYRHEANLNSKPVTQVLTDIQTLSISTYREKQPVRNLGSIGPRAYTRGPRTVAGSMVFTLFNKDVLYDAMRMQPGDADLNDVAPLNDPLRYVLIDQIPPFDIVIMFSNEYGFNSRQILYGVEIASTGQVMSIEDLFTEKTVQYVAADLTPITPLNEKSVLAPNEEFDLKVDNGDNRFDTILSTKLAQRILSSTRNPFK